MHVIEVTQPGVNTEARWIIDPTNKLFELWVILHVVIKRWKK